MSVYMGTAMSRTPMPQYHGAPKSSPEKAQTDYKTFLGVGTGWFPKYGY